MKQAKLTFTGGLPLSQNVLAWTQTGFKEAIDAICTMGYNGTPISLYGCYYDSATNDVSPGWIYDGTELLYFAGGNTVTAGTDKWKMQETTSTLVFEDGSVRDVYSTKQIVLDATGGHSFIGMRRYGYAAGLSIPIAVTEATGTLDVHINTAARIIRFYGRIDTLTAAALSSDGLQVKLLDDSDIKTAMGEYYPNDIFEFLGAVMPEPGNNGVFNDLNGIPIQSVPFRFNNGGFFVHLRKTASGEYPVFFSHTIILR